MPAPQREVNVEARLFQGVKKRGGIALKLTRWGGIPDRALILPGGRTVYVELKRPKDGRLTWRQRLTHARLRKMGHEVEVLWSREEVDEWLRSEDLRTSTISSRAR